MSIVTVHNKQKGKALKMPFAVFKMCQILNKLLLSINECESLMRRLIPSVGAKVCK